MIAILGTGLLGSGFTRALRKRGETVHVWNRSPARAEALREVGAVPFTHADEAIREAACIHIVVSDDAAVDSVIAAAAPAAGAVIYDHTTTSTAGSLARTKALAARGVTYLHAPVFMGPANAAESTGVMMMSGDRAVCAAAQPVLAPMTGKLVDLGERVDAAAAFKLMGNLFLMAINTGFADLFALAKAVGVPSDSAKTLIEFFNPGTTLKARLDRMASGNYDHPSWELAMARKDARLIQAEADAAGVPLAIVPAIAARMDAVIAQGFGNADWTVLGRDFVTPAK
jgi:3-hydroxyisobutyrate dehydrogenase